MKLLASRNIVTIRQGSGTYVASTPGMVEDPPGFTFIVDKKKLVQDLLEVRILLEPSIASMAAVHADDEDIKKSPHYAMKSKTCSMKKRITHKRILNFIMP